MTLGCGKTRLIAHRDSYTTMSRGHDQPDTSHQAHPSRSRNASSRLLDGSNGEAPSAAHQILLEQTQARRNTGNYAFLLHDSRVILIHGTQTCSHCHRSTHQEHRRPIFLSAEHGVRRDRARRDLSSYNDHSRPRRRQCRFYFQSSV